VEVETVGVERNYQKNIEKIGDKNGFDDSSFHRDLYAASLYLIVELPLT